MPTYDYKCPSCGLVFENFHGMNEKPDVNCPKCSTLAEKQFAVGAGIQFKGNGFYVNDYKTSPNSSSSSQGSAGSAGSTSGSSCAGGSCGCGA